MDSVPTHHCGFYLNLVILLLALLTEQGSGWTRWTFYPASVWNYRCRKIRSLSRLAGVLDGRGDFISSSVGSLNGEIKATTSKQNQDNQIADDAFTSLAFFVTKCLLASDTKRDTGFDGASTGWTSWIEQQSEFLLRSCLDKICLNTSFDEE